MDRLIIIKQVMQELNKRSIKYCILRNYDFLLEERLPEKQSERSVDIAVHREDYQTFHEILTNLFFKLCGRLAFINLYSLMQKI